MKRLRIESDCAMLNAMVLALESLQIRFDNVLAVDKDVLQDLRGAT